VHQEQSLLLLAYLAHEGPKARQHLAPVFWSHAKVPRNNLSSALTRINAAAPGIVHDNNGRLSVSARTSAQAMRHALAEGDTEGALALYEGPFLDGISARNIGMELEEWIFEQREALAAELALAAATEARLLVTRGELPSAVALAERAFEISCGGMPGHTVLSLCRNVLAPTDSPSVSRIDQLATDFGINLDRETALRGTRPDQPASQESRASVAATTSGLIGRFEELALLRHRTATPGVTVVVGMGGVGKTTLAHEAVAEYRRSGGTAKWVSLASAHPTDVLQTIADVLEVEFVDQSAFVDQVAQRWQDDHLLIVLDNAEHITDIAEVIDVLQQAAPASHVVVTTRRDHPHPGATSIRLSGLRTDGEEQGSAYALFVREARRIQPEFPRDENEQRLAHDICAHLRGLPLAIEVLTSLLKIESIGALAQQSAEAAVSERTSHVLAASWKLLGPELQRCLSGLSFFVAPFSLQGAADIVQTEVATLQQLVDHSLVAVVEPGWLELHPLVAAFARGQHSESGHSASVEARFHDHYVHLLEQDGEHADDVNAELPNILEAWRRAVSTRTWDRVSRMVQPLHDFLQRTNRLHLAHQTFSQALVALQGQTPPHPRVIAEVANCHAWIAWRRGNLAESRISLELAASAVDNTDRALRIRILQTEAAIALADGNPDAAMQAHEHASSLIDQDTDPLLSVRVLEGLGECARIRGETDRSRAAFRDALHLGRRLENPHLIARSYLMLGCVERQENPDRAVICLEQGLAIAAEHELVQLRSVFPAELGYAHLDRERLVEAEEQFRCAQQEVQADEAWMRAYIETGLALVHTRAGRHREATELLLRSTRSAQAAGDWPTLLESLLGICELRLATGPATEVPGLLATIINHSAAEANHIRAGQQLLGSAQAVAPLLGPDATFDEAAETGMELLRFG